VTIADKEAEHYLRGQIESKFTDDGVIGEEFDERPGTSGYRWIIDPIDGTKSFIHRVPLYGTLVGIEYAGESVVGVMLFPALDEIIYAATGHGAWHAQRDVSAKKARVSQTETLSESLFCYTCVDTFHEVNRQQAFETLRQQCKLDRGWSDAYGYLLVATGRADIMLDPVLSIWDMACMPPILTEAGGTFTDWQGRATIHGEDGLATNGQLLEAALAVTRQA
jgi:histidinol phosphatase-like enzyme (inositol monophosphatase family)